MRRIIVGVADYGVGAGPDDVLITYALGSCIAVALHDPVARVGGLLHYMLPDSVIDRRRAASEPCLFADTGIPFLMRTLLELGARKENLTVRAAGGARLLHAKGRFDIGKRNCAALRRLLRREGFQIHSERMGGETSRTVSLEVATGRFWWREANGAEGELEVPGQRKCRWGG